VPGRFELYGEEVSRPNGLDDFQQVDASRFDLQ
jgi:hypothetical protein